MKKSKKLFLVLLSFMLIGMIFGTSLTAQASFISDAQNVEFNTTYNRYGSRSDPYVSMANDNYSYHSFIFTVPERGTVTIYLRSSNDYYFAYGLDIYDINNVYFDEEIWHGTLNVNPKYDVNNREYYNSISVELEKGTYCFVKEYCNQFSEAFEGSYDIEFQYKPKISYPSTFSVVSRKTTSLDLSWSKVSGVKGYQLQQKVGESYKTIADTTATTYTVSKLASGTNYAFRIRAYKVLDGKKYYSAWKSLTTPTIPSKVSVKVSARTTTSLKLAWAKVTGASGYQIQQKSGDSYKTLATTTGTAYTISKLKAGTNYTFRIRAYKTVSNTKYYSEWTTLTTPTLPGKVAIKAPATNTKHQITAKWTALTAGTGYQVQFSKKKDFSSSTTTKTVSGISKSSYTGSNFTKNTTYYIRVRAYKTVSDKNYYGAWSDVKAIKCK